MRSILGPVAALTAAISIFVCSALEAAASSFTGEQVEQALRELDSELRLRDEYIARRSHHLDSLKAESARMFGSDSLRALLMTMEIALGYNSFNNDSALMYYTRGYDMTRDFAAQAPSAAVRAKADSLAAEFRVRRATYLSLSGFISDALSEVSAIDTTGFSPDARASYHDAVRQMCYYISNYYAGWPETFDYWTNVTMEHQRALQSLLKPGGFHYRLNQAEYYFNVREYARSRDILLDLLKNLDRNTPYYAIVTHTLASIALARGDRNEYLYYLAESAIADLRQATLEITSLQELAGVLYESGDTGRAHKYINVAIRNAVASRASVRMMKTTELLSMVENDHNRQINRWRTGMYALNTVLILSLVALLVLMGFLRRENKRIARMRKELADANQTKDVYISQFLSLCSVYMDKLKQFGKLVNRKISAGQVDDLAKLTKSSKFVEEQSADFYKVFDDAFLHIYPHFVEGVNRLLRPEECIVLAEGEMLNSDLRILAFMRLGIDDTNRVAQILNFSVNTIYAYRNRLRNRAINRDTFERDIMAIGSFDIPPAR